MTTGDSAAVPGRDQRREDTLRQCEAEAAAWSARPGRNLVLLFDGTGNILGNQADTNVVRLLRMLRKQPPFEQADAQLVYYDPGVGTEAHDFPPDGIGAKLLGRLRQIEGLAFGRGAFENVAQAYEFLCREWREGDRIWLFGFSRGAFTARSVAGMVNMYGLVPAAGLPLVRTLVRTYYARKSPLRDTFAADVLTHFSLGRTPLVHFTGVWDTVETVGLARGVKITNSGRTAHKRFTHIRHALALHETRSKYAPREYEPPGFTERELKVRSFGQRWFRGVHSDVGGSYAEAGLSNIALNWMVREARACGLEVDPSIRHPEDPAQAMHDQVLESPYWLLTGVDARDRSKIVADIDPTALPIEAATPARRSPHAWLARTLGITLFVATLVFGMLAFTDRAGPWRWPLLAAGWLWLPFPAAWVLRRWCRAAIAKGERLPAVAAKAHWGLWLLLAAGVILNVRA
jgi:uncharacterized protein (DUF2235 family)